MTTTYCTDAEIDATDTLARTALAAFSQAAVDRGDAAVTDYDALRVEAKRQLLIDLGARGITEGMVSDPAQLEVPEGCLVLANLFDAVGQWNGTVPDVYVQKGSRYRQRYEALIARVNPRLEERPVGASFEWGRG